MKGAESDVILGADLFQLMSTRLRWLGERQAVLGQNLANADTPDYVPRDLRPRDFERLVAGLLPGRTRLAMAATAAGHLTGTPSPRQSVHAHEQRETFEVAPNGNAVVLDEQMAKLSETALDHQMTSNLYRKYTGMLRLALGTQR